MRHRDGGTRWFDTTSQSVRDAHGAVTEVVSVSRDVTTAVEATTALALSEDRFRHAFDLAPTGMAISDLGGRMVRVNEAFGRLLDHAAGDLVGRTIASITHPDDRGADDVNTLRIRDGAEVRQRVRKRYLSRTGRTVPVVVEVSVVGDGDGRPAHLVAHIVPVETLGSGSGAG